MRLGGQMRRVFAQQIGLHFLAGPQGDRQKHKLSDQPGGVVVSPTRPSEIRHSHAEHPGCTGRVARGQARVRNGSSKVGHHVGQLSLRLRVKFVPAVTVPDVSHQRRTLSRNTKNLRRIRRISNEGFPQSSVPLEKLHLLRLCPQRRQDARRAEQHNGKKPKEAWFVLAVHLVRNTMRSCNPEFTCGCRPPNPPSWDTETALQCWKNSTISRAIVAFVQQQGGFPLHHRKRVFNSHSSLNRKIRRSPRIGTVAQVTEYQQITVSRIRNRPFFIRLDEFLEAHCCTYESSSSSLTNN